MDVRQHQCTFYRAAVMHDSGGVWQGCTHALRAQIPARGKPAYATLLSIFLQGSRPYFFFIARDIVQRRASKAHWQ